MRVTPLALTTPPTPEARRDGSSVWELPSRHRWALRSTVNQEQYLLHVATEATGHRIEAQAAIEAATRHGLSSDQAQAVVGLLTADERIGRLVGPAGAGKTRALRAVADAWQRAGREVPGLTVSQAAAEVLAEGAHIRVENTAKWRHESRSGRWSLPDAALVIVDEASMIPTPDLVEVVSRVRDVGGRVLLVGDPNQLGAITIGGSFDLLVDHHGASDLERVRRFENDCERQASLRLRQRHPLAILDYARHGRVHGGRTAATHAHVGEHERAGCPSVGTG